jgi:F-type H+-transporting ATPase subunit gamma
MPSLRAIRKRIASVKNTKQITKAMKMVAAAKMRGAEERLHKSRPYAKKLDEVISDLVARAGIENYLLLAGREQPTKAELIVVTSDRGLAGGFNTQINKAAEEQFRALKQKYEQVTVSVVGRKGRDYLKRRNYPLRRVYTNVLGQFDFSLAVDIGKEFVEDFRAGEFDVAYVIYNEFLTAMSQTLVVRQLLPLAHVEARERATFVDFRYAPSQEAILETLLPREAYYILYKAFIESFAAEMGARMTAMDSATRNAEEMISALTLQFNRARQAAITKELMEIINGAEALKG